MDDQPPEMECVPLGSLGEQFAIMQKMLIMQRTHNTLAKDLETLADIAMDNINSPARIKPLIRACIKELFSLIEADLYLINQYLPYDDYNDLDNLSKKFKKTYRHHSKYFKKNKLNKQYQSSSYGRLYRLKLKRDTFAHPKTLQAIDVTTADLDEVIAVYHEYRSYIVKLMTNIGFSVQLPISW